MKKYTILLLASSLLSLGTTQAVTQDITKCYGQSVTLKASETGDSYQWYKNGTAISGETQNEYKVTNLEKSAKYECKITTNGTSTNTGNLITLGGFEFPAKKPTLRDENKLGDWIDYQYLNFDNKGVNIGIGACTTAKNANDVKTAYFSDLKPHSGDYLLVCDGASDPDARVWSARNLKLKGGVEYQFSCWAANIDKEYALHGANSLPKLKFVIENETGKHTLLEFTASTTLGKWNEYKATYIPPKDLNWCHIYIVNYTTEPAGNDFALDDVYFGTVINSSASSVTDVFNVTVYDNAKLSFSTPEVCPGTSATITTTVTAEHNGTLDKNIKYTWKDASNTNVGSSKDLTTIAPTSLGKHSYKLTAKGDYCKEAEGLAEIKVKDCGVEKPIPHPVQEACPGVEVELTCTTSITGAQSVKWEHDSSSGQSAKVNAGPNIGDKKDFKCTIVKIEGGNTVTYIETFSILTINCTSEETETHNLSDCPKQEVTLTCTTTADATQDKIVWSHDPSLQSTTTTVKTKDTPAAEGTPNTPDTYTCTITKVNDKGETFIYTETFNVTTKNDCVGENKEKEELTIGSSVTIQSDYWNITGAIFEWYKVVDGVNTPVPGDTDNPGKLTFKANESITYFCITTLPNGYVYTETRVIEVHNDTEKDVYICYNDDFSVTATTEDASEYKWYDTTNDTKVLSEIETLEIKELKQNTSYICRIIGADKITKITETYHVKVNPLPEFNVEVKVANVTVDITNGSAPYELSLSNGTTSTATSNEYTYENLVEDTYTLSITDKNKCVYANEFTISIPKLEPMKFFSPNNDNLNDLWLVHGIETAPNAYIRIYDRHSKLLYQCKGSEFQGWDGKYETKDMVQDDYWYVISVPETEETLSGHFTLKR